MRGFQPPDRPALPAYIDPASRVPPGEQAQHFAERVQQERPDLPGQVSRAHELAFGRPPDATALAPLVDFAKANGLPAMCRVLFNLNEFTFTD